jgi:outer membrane protein assembly factor BamA
MVRYLDVKALALAVLIAQSAGAQESVAAVRIPSDTLRAAIASPQALPVGGAVAGYYAGGGLGARPTSVLSSLTVTAHRQIIAEALPELYFDGGRLWLNGKLRVMRYPNVFYGIGNGTTADMEEGFTSRSLALELQAQRKVARASWIGARTQPQSEDIIDLEAGRLLAAGGVAGAEGGTAAGLGVVATRDTRDRTIAPRKGVLAEARWTGFAPLLGSDFRYGLASMNARGYTPLGPGVLAVRAHAEAAHGAAPFTLLPKLGGSRLLRGYREGRFRDDLLGVVEAEYRFPIAWRFGGVVFGGVGDVASSFHDLPALDGVERAIGAGLRFRVNQAGVNIRLDWARGREEGGLYLGLGETF